MGVRDSLSVEQQNLVPEWLNKAQGKNGFERGLAGSYIAHPGSLNSEQNGNSPKYRSNSGEFHYFSSIFNDGGRPLPHSCRYGRHVSGGPEDFNRSRDHRGDFFPFFDKHPPFFDSRRIPGRGNFRNEVRGRLLDMPRPSMYYKHGSPDMMHGGQPDAWRHPNSYNNFHGHPPNGSYNGNGFDILYSKHNPYSIDDHGFVSGMYGDFPDKASRGRYNRNRTEVGGRTLEEFPALGGSTQTSNLSSQLPTWEKPLAQIVKSESSAEKNDSVKRKEGYQVLMPINRQGKKQDKSIPSDSPGQSSKGRSDSKPSVMKSKSTTNQSRFQLDVPIAQEILSNQIITAPSRKLMRNKKEFLRSLSIANNYSDSSAEDSLSKENQDFDFDEVKGIFPANFANGEASNDTCGTSGEGSPVFRFPDENEEKKFLEIMGWPNEDLEQQVEDGLTQDEIHEFEKLNGLCKNGMADKANSLASRCSNRRTEWERCKANLTSSSG